MWAHSMEVRVRKKLAQNKAQKAKELINMEEY
jgi:hypothetical protein